MTPAQRRRRALFKKKFKETAIAQPLRRRRMSNFTGFLHPQIGTGEIHFTNGIMDFCDDGNGQQWMDGDDDLDEPEF